jgi:hypothetical protein
VAAGVHALSLAVAFVTLFWLTRHLWFLLDEWEFIGPRLANGDLQLMTPHNEHWSTLPLLIYRGLYGVVGIRSYLPYMAVLLALMLLAAHLLWQVMRRSGVHPALATLLVIPFLFLGAGFDNYVSAFQLSFVGSVAFGLAQALLVDHADPRFGARDVAGWLAGLASLMFSGIGVTMLAVALLVGLFRRGVRGAAIAASVPLAAYLVWFFTVGRHGLGHEVLTPSQALQLPDYIWTGLTQTADGATGLVGAGAVLVVGLAAWMVRNAPMVCGRGAIGAAGIGGVVVLFVTTGAVRLSVGNGIAPRYVYVATALLIPAAALALNAMVAASWLRIAALGAVLVVLSTFHGVNELHTWVNIFTDRDQQLRARILAAASLVSNDTSRVVGLQPEPMSAPNLDVHELHELISQGALPSASGVDEAARLYAAEQLYVDLRTGAPDASVPAARVGVVSTSDARTSALTPGCITVQPSGAHPRLRLRVVSGGGLRVLSETGGALHILMATPDTPPDLPLPDRQLTLTGGQEAELLLTWNGATPLVEIPAAGTTVVCATGVAAPPA